MTPPVLLDLTGDDVVDIVFATYNSTVVALDGHTYETLWNFTYPLSETYASVYELDVSCSIHRKKIQYNYITHMCTRVPADK